ncbi:MAG: hypothetical protein J07HR59_01303 [Halorubrum sp. J07HR59]|nr:MAG: hypothetical protein J07HR59_01303 [Halorubrum sp. J07HR59]
MYTQSPYRKGLFLYARTPRKDPSIQYQSVRSGQDITVKGMKPHVTDDRETTIDRGRSS